MGWVARHTRADPFLGKRRAEPRIRAVRARSLSHSPPIADSVVVVVSPASTTDAA
ncbi:hypothetical protein NUM_06040 [Actinocatenispora comari]|jgi:hypothetical protein|uniref:Uncharacterized protein n=1 Tax=Actinocatenispora comari TaxID=2807577 RepID=A0A8J4A5G1_9ACTN|nr:hypothetical protein NUM_06040 [Actinocatenispora comari]